MNILKYLVIIVLFVAAGFYGMILLSPSEIEFRVNEDISTPIDEVYKGITNPQTWGKWVEGVERVKQKKGDGFSQGSVSDVFFPQEMMMTKELRLAEVNKQIVLHGVVIDFFSKTESYILEVLDSNTTRVSCSIKMKALKNKSKMIMRAKETHTQNMAKNLTSLKNYLEQ
ncbi:MAG: SRPBCC family protein [Bacteroidia bacterium]